MMELTRPVCLSVQPPAPNLAADTRAALIWPMQPPAPSDPLLTPLRISLFILLLFSLSCATGPRTRDAAGLVHFTLHAPDARQVSLAGTFNRWDPAAHFLTGPGPDGSWRLGLPLAPGRYEYLYVIDGTKWVPDPAAPWADDGLGGRNSVVVVPREEGP